MSEEQYLLIKRGLYWRPNSLGYTALKKDAGRYSREEAEKRINEDVQMIEETKADEFSPACDVHTKLAAERTKVKELEAQNAVMREALEKANRNLERHREYVRDNEYICPFHFGETINGIKQALQSKDDALAKYVNEAREKALDEAAHFVWECECGGKSYKDVPNAIRALKQSNERG